MFRAMSGARVPSSNGSLRDGDLPRGDADATTYGDEVAGNRDPGSDGFDSEEFREFLRQREARRGGHGGGGARRGLRAGRRREEDESDDDRQGGSTGKGASGNPPEWDGTTSFQDWLIKARLWLATTRARPKTQGPLILQRLSGPAFQAFKHWARDAEWLQDDRGGFKLLEAMNSPDQFGDDKEEDLLASLAKITYHLRRGRDEGLRTFFARWDESLRKVREHSVTLPDKYLGFLLINALNLSDQEIKGMLTFTRGSIVPAEVKSWARKHEMKLNAKEIGLEKERKLSGSATKAGTQGVHYVVDDEDADEEIMMMEDALQELRVEDWQEEDPPEADGNILDEHEVAEILNTMVQKKRTFMQSLKTKKAKGLSRGYGNWKGGKGDAANGSNPSSSRSSTTFQASGRLRSGFYKMSLEEMKANSRCSKCLQVGHWHKDAVCPKNQRGKETHYIEKTDEKEINAMELEEAIFCGWMEKDDSAHHDEMSPNTHEKSSAFCRDVTPKVEDVSEWNFSRTDLTTDQAVGSLGRNLGNVYSEGDYKTGYCSSDVCEVFQGHHEGFVDSSCISEKEILWGKTDDSVRQPESPEDQLCGTIDTGCQRMAIGSETLHRFSLLLPPELKVGTLKQEFQFRSVHGRSKTTQVATIPTSLGTNGSILKPAIFTGENSEHAPFLISLPFLLSCRTVLHLDPSCGLRAEFKRLGFSVKCHIGPTGALRIPLGEFTEQQRVKVSKLMQRMKHGSTEFEILKTATTESYSGNNGSSSHSKADPTRSSSPDDVRCRWQEDSHYRAREGEEQEPTGLGEGCRQTPLPDVPNDGTPSQLAGAQDAESGAQPSGEAPLDSECISGHRAGGWRFRSRDGQLRDGGLTGSDLSGVHLGQRESGASYSKSDVVSPDPGRAVSSGGAGQDLWPGTTLPAQPAVQVVHVPQTRTQSTPDVLALSRSSSTSMQDLPVDPVSTTLGGGFLPVPVRDTKYDDFTTTPPSSEGASGRGRISNMPTPHHDSCRNQRICREGEVQVLPQGAGGSQEDQGGDPSRVREEEEGRQVGRHADLDGAGEGAVRGVPQVPELAADEGGGLEQQSQPGAQEDEIEEVRSFVMSRPRAQKRMKRVVRQATTALECAEAMWHEVMNLLSVQPQSVEQTGWDRWSQKTFSNSDQSKIPYSRSSQKYQNLLGLDAKQMKTVAEIYNPNRFRKETEKQGLVHGNAFDLELGHDLLNPQMQNEVESYVRNVKPGLTVISPPCTLLSLMQNMNRKYLDDPQKKRIHDQRLREAKELLRFGVRIAKVIQEYGGIFLIEQPLTSKAWQCDELYQLLHEEGVYIGRGDQCMYGLKSVKGEPQLKPTGWCSNSEILIRELSRRCDQSHTHSHILGSEHGQLCSRRAQVYPAELIQAIIFRLQEAPQGRVLVRGICQGQPVV